MFPLALHLGSLDVPFYEGFYFLVSFLAAGLWTARRWKRAALRADGASHGEEGRSVRAEDAAPAGQALTEAALERLFAYIVITAIIGARLSHFLFWDPAVLLVDPLEFLRVWNGGLSVTGGVAGGALGAWLAARRSGVDFRSVAAIAVPPTLLGQAIGRVGCFLNGDAFGSPSSLPWAVSFPRYAIQFPGGGPDRRWSSFAWTWCRDRGLVAPESLAGIPMHPTQLYEALLDLCLLGLILVYQKRRPGRKGGRASLLAYVGGYSAIRFALEFIRADHDGTVLLGMTGLQLALATVALLCLVLALLHSGKGPKDARRA